MNRAQHAYQLVRRASGAAIPTAEQSTFTMRVVGSQTVMNIDPWVAKWQGKWLDLTGQSTAAGSALLGQGARTQFEALLESATVVRSDPDLQFGGTDFVLELPAGDILRLTGIVSYMPKSAVASIAGKGVIVALVDPSSVLREMYLDQTRTTFTGVSSELAAQLHLASFNATINTKAAPQEIQLPAKDLIVRQ